MARPGFRFQLPGGGSFPRGSAIFRSRIEQRPCLAPNSRTTSAAAGRRALGRRAVGLHAADPQFRAVPKDERGSDYMLL